MKALLLLFLLSSLASAEDHVFLGFTLTGSGEPLRNAAMTVTTGGLPGWAQRLG